MAKAGRHTKLTPKKKKIIIEAVERGNYIETAAALAGVSKSTLYNWKNRGERELERLEKYPEAEESQTERPFLEFLDALTRAMAVAEDRDVQIIDKAAEDDWRASAWRLERRNAKRWGKKESLDANLQHSGKGGGAVQTESKIDLSNLSNEELTLLGSIIAKKSESNDN